MSDVDVQGDGKTVAARLVRTQGGRMIHKDTCRYNVNSVPWQWADGRWTVDIVLAADQTGSWFCRVCKPCGVVTRIVGTDHV